MPVSIFKLWFDFWYAWYTCLSGIKLRDGHFCMREFGPEDGCVMGADPLEGYVG